jgi:hypothetical protein
MNEEAVLNTLTEDDFQDTLKMAEELRMVHKCGRGTTMSAMMASRPKVSFDHMAAPVSEIMGGSL